MEDAHTIAIRNEGQMRTTSITTRDQERDQESDGTQDDASATTQSPPSLPPPNKQDPQAAWYQSPPPVMNPYTGQVRPVPIPPRLQTMIADLQDHTDWFGEEDKVTTQIYTPKRPTSVIDLITPTARPPRPQEDAPDGFVPVGKGRHHSNTGSYRPSPPMSETSSPMTTTSNR